MNSNCFMILRSGMAVFACLLLGACAGSGTPRPVVAVELPENLSPLAYYPTLAKMTAAEFMRERSVLAALPQTPGVQVRQAMVYCHPRGTLEAGKATLLLDSVLKAGDAEAVALQPLARLLADQCQERQRLELDRSRLDAAYERQGVQFRELQKKSAELQEKIEGLADIERTLPERSRLPRPAAKVTK